MFKNGGPLGWLNRLRAILVHAGTQNITACTLQVGTYCWRELTHEEYPPQHLPHMHRNCYRPLLRGCVMWSVISFLASLYTSCLHQFHGTKWTPYSSHWCHNLCNGASGHSYSQRAQLVGVIFGRLRRPKLAKKLRFYKASKKWLHICIHSS